MTKTLSFLVITMLAFTPMSIRAEPFELKGNVLGMTLSEWKDKHGCNPFCERNPRWVYPSPGVGEFQYKLRTTVANQEADVHFYFSNTTTDGSDDNYYLFLIDVVPADLKNPAFGFNLRTALVTKYGEPQGTRYPDSDDPDEVTSFNRPAESWKRNGGELLFSDSDTRIRIPEMKMVHWGLWERHRAMQNGRLANDL